MEILTDGRTITETDLVMFSYFTGDWTFLHTDVEAARKSIFGERVAHGYLTLSVSLGLMIRSGAINADVFMALKSIEYVKFLKPVKINDTLRVAYSPERTPSSPGVTLVTVNARTMNQNNDDVLKFRTSHLERNSQEK
ncbi:MAG: MaoC/PaaZ C-terminal domain-containing protein [Thermoplasmataceae archaeon]